MMSAHEVYSNAVLAMPRAERLRLAALILDDLTSDGGLSDLESEWTDDDLRDATAFSLAYASARYPEEDDLV